MKVPDLIAQLQQLPQDKSILCQVVASQSPGAWNMHFNFNDVPDSTMVQLAVHHPSLTVLPPINRDPVPGVLKVLDHALNQARGISRDHPGSTILAAHVGHLEAVRAIASDLIVTQAELLRRVDERCNGRMEGTSPLAAACNASRAVLARVEGFTPNPNGEPACS